MGSRLVSILRPASSDTILGLGAIALGLLIWAQATPASVAKPTQQEAMLMCDPFLTGCDGMIALSGPTVDHANWVFTDPTALSAPMDGDMALSVNPNARVILYIEDDDQYVGPMTQADAMAYVDAGAQYFVEGQPAYNKALVAIKSQDATDGPVIVALNN